MTPIKQKAMTFFGLGSSAMIVDFLSANLLYYIMGWSVTLCGMIGFLAGTLVAYTIHLNITFASRQLNFSWKSLSRFLKSSIAIAFLRIIALGLLDFLTNLYGFVTLLLSILLSSLARFLLASFYVFKTPSMNDLLEPPPSDTMTPLSESGLRPWWKNLWKTK